MMCVEQPQQPSDSWRLRDELSSMTGKAHGLSDAVQYSTSRDFGALNDWQHSSLSDLVRRRGCADDEKVERCDAPDKNHKAKATVIIFVPPLVL
jgi:hypothetical protein